MSKDESSVLLSPDLVIADASDAYCEQTMIDRDEVRGVHLFDVFPESGDARTEDGASVIRRSVEEVVRTGRSNALPLFRYDVPDAESSVLVEKYWATTNHPIFVADSNEITHVTFEVRDVTALVVLERQLEARAQALIEQQELLRLMQADFERATRELVEQKRQLTARMAGEESLADEALLARVHDRSSLLAPTTHAPRAGIYRALHPPECHTGAMRLFMRKGQVLPRCSDCGARVRYRWKA